MVQIPCYLTNSDANVLWTITDVLDGMIKDFLPKIAIIR